MNVERIVKEIRAVFECDISSQEFKYKIEDNFYKVLEIDLNADSINKEEFEKLNNVLFEYDLKIIEFGISGYTDTLYICLIEK